MSRWTIPSILPLILSFFCCCNGQQRFIVVTPNLIRTDTVENIYLQANGLAESSSVSVSITIRRFLTGFRTENPLTQSFVTLDQQNGFHSLVPIQVPSYNLNRDEREYKFVIVNVQFGDYHSEERVVLVSFQAGYIFIMTDKPIYRPGESVRFRAFVSSPSFKASGTNAITVDLKNPDGVVLEQDLNRKPFHGIYSGDYTLPDMAKEGKWGLFARFDHWPQNNFNTTFVVKQYVLPAFNVTLTPAKPYLDVDDTELDVHIKARYLFNRPVNGTAFVLYGLKKDDRMMRAPNVKKVPMLEDGGTLTLSMSEIQEACVQSSRGAAPDCSAAALVDSYVYIKVTVITASGGDLVEVERSDIKIVRSPYVITLSKMKKYFKPGMPFHFIINVAFHDGTPANNVNLKVNLLDKILTTKDGFASASVNMPSQASAQEITVTTTTGGAERQAIKSVTVEPYQPANPNSPNYLYIHGGISKVDLGSLSMVLNIKSANVKSIKDVTYLIISKGKILEVNRTAAESLISVTTEVTTEMMPMFRFVAFYTIGAEVVSDSVELEVSKTCVHTPVLHLPRETVPKARLSLKIEGEPQANISLVAVDQAVYLLNKNRFTQKHILDEMNSRDMGCTLGSGKDAMGVFSDAGLLFAMNDGPSMQSRQELKCPDSTRGRRSAELVAEQFDLAGEFQEKFLQRCCRDGLRGVLMPYSCEQRSLFITEGPECIRAFLKCCRLKHQVYARRPLLTLGRGVGGAAGTTSEVPDSGPLASSLQGEEEPFDVNSIELRNKFYEAWLWRDVVLPSGVDGKASVIVEDAVPDSITEWAVHAVSSSSETGFCVAKPSTFVVRQNFFVDLKMPSIVARKEQVEIKAVVYNYLERDLEVTVVLERTRGICSEAFKRQYAQKKTVKPGTSISVPYAIVPLEKGDFQITVAAYVKNLAEDRVEKTLKVVMEGVQKTQSYSVQLNPSAHGGTQVITLSKPVLKGVVPKSDPETKIKLSGDILADSIENAIQDDPLAQLIKKPGGCVEQNVAKMSFPVIAALYLDQTNGWRNVGVQRRINAVEYIKTGYKKQVQYELYDNSYPPFSGREGSTWLTAYVVKVFSMAYHIIRNEIKVDRICKPLLFVEKRQNSDGSFSERQPLWDNSITGGLKTDDTVTLTAFVVIVLAELKNRDFDCSYEVNTETLINNAVPYLKVALQRNPRPYTVAITSYALALLKDEISFDPTPFLLRASSDGTFWPDADSQFSLEATGYALLALLKMGKLSEAKKPFDYLSNNRGIGYGYGNTQSTVVVLQALSEYLIMQPPPVSQSLDVDLSIAARSEVLRFTSDTSYRARSFNVPKDADLKVEARGNGMGMIEVLTEYHQLPEEDSKSCKSFFLEVSIQKSTEKSMVETVNVFELIIQVKAIGPTPAVSVTLDISLPTGFTADTEDLKKLLKTVEKYIDHFYFDDKLSDRSSLIIHIYKVSNEMPHMLTFRLLQQFKVGHLQPSSVTAYEYYKDEEKRCTRTYTPPQDQAQLSTICRGYACACAHGDCCEVLEASDDVEDADRAALPCTTLHHVFKVKVLVVSHDYYNKYLMEIQRVIKLGVEDGVVDSEQRYFFSHTGCTKECQLKQGSEYLIMGPESDRWTIDTNTNKYMYLLGKDTWVEQWPTATESKVRSQSLEDFAAELLRKGCTM